MPAVRVRYGMVRYGTVRYERTGDVRLGLHTCEPGSVKGRRCTLEELWAECQLRLAAEAMLVCYGNFTHTLRWNCAAELHSRRAGLNARDRWS